MAEIITTGKTVDEAVEEKMRELAQPMLKNQYGQYLLKVIDEYKSEITSDTLTHLQRN